MQDTLADSSDRGCPSRIVKPHDHLTDIAGVDYKTDHIVLDEMEHCAACVAFEPRGNVVVLFPFSERSL